MPSTRWTVALAVLAAGPAFGADPLTRTDLVGDPLPAGAIARVGSVRFMPRPYLDQVFFSADGKTILGRGGDNVIDFWEADTGKPLAELRDPDIINFRMDQSPDGKQLALFGSDRRGKPAPDAALRVYDLATRKPLWTQVIDDQYYYSFAVRYAPDGQHIITATQVEIRVRDAKTGAEVRRARPGAGSGGLTLSPDGKTLAICGETGVYFWDWTADAPPRKLDTGNRRYTNVLTFSADGKTLYGRDQYSNDTAHAYDVATGEFQGKADGSVLEWHAPSPDGKTIAAAEYDAEKREGWVVLRDAAGGKEVGRLSSGPLMVRDGRWSKDGTRLAAATPYRGWVWDVKTGKAFGPTVDCHPMLVNGLAFTSDGRLVSAGDDRTIRAWDPATGKERARIPTSDRVWQFAASGDGSLLAGSVEPGNVRVWDAKTGKEVFKLQWTLSRTGGAPRIVFTADDQTLLTYTHDYYVRTWDLLTGKLKSERRFRPTELLGPESDDNRNEEMGLLMLKTDLGADGDTFVQTLRKQVAVYSVATGRERMKLDADEQLVQNVVLSADGKRLAASGVGPPGPPVGLGMVVPARTHYFVGIWDLTQAKRLARIRVRGSSFFNVLAFTPDGKRLVTGSDDEQLRFWDAATGEPVGQIDVPRVPRRVAFTPDARLLAVTFSDPTILVYDVEKALKPMKEP